MIRDMLHVGRFAVEDRDLQTIVVIEMHMQRRAGQSVMPMKILRELFGRSRLEWS